MNVDRKVTVLIAEVNPTLVDLLSQSVMKNGYKTLRSKTSGEIFDILKKFPVDVVLAGMKMPPIAGVDLHRKIAETNPGIPVIMLAAFDELIGAHNAVKAGAFDFVTVNPYDEGFVIRAIKKAVDIVQARQIKAAFRETVDAEIRKTLADNNEMIARSRLTTLEMVRRLLTAAEFRDDETGGHIKRIGMYATVIAASFNMDKTFKDTIAVASSMHDLGKIGIPDSILLKPSGLSPDEFETMKKHTVIGNKILAGSSNDYITMAANIALGHHERWDGTGYPQGLRGEAIAMECRIALVCDQYDALRSKRPYKPALDHTATMKILTEGDGRTKPEHFDPKVLTAFVKVAPLCEKIFDTNSTAE